MGMSGPTKRIDHTLHANWDTPKPLRERPVEASLQDRMDWARLDRLAAIDALAIRWEKYEQSVVWTLVMFLTWVHA